MKNILLAGAAGLLVAFAAADASAATVYEYPDGAVEYGPSEPAYVAPAPMVEGRAAYVENAPVVVAQPGYYYGPHRYYYERAPFPFSVLPWNW